MKCPRCDTTTLDERDREGVVIDVCRQCRGLWLDRGELEKLIARSTRDLDELERRASPAPEQRAPSPDYGAPRSRRDSDHDFHHHGDPHYRHRRKKSFIESLGDIFD